MDSTNRDANFADLPAAFLRSVAEALWEDGKDLAHLIATCKGVRAVCDETNIWKKLVVRRFGDSVIPGTRPTAGIVTLQPLFITIMPPACNHSKLCVLLQVSMHLNSWRAGCSIKAEMLQRNLTNGTLKLPAVLLSNS